MTFTPPTFSKFRVSTLNLDASLSTKIGRYKIVEIPMINHFSSVKQDSLDVLIARTNAVLECNTDRQPARDVFIKLVNELRQIPKDMEDKRREGAMFLLGALIHRYFRIINEYDNYNRIPFWTFDPMNCNLFKSIRTALKLDILPRVHDLATLDVTTIVTSLEVFRDNMLLVLDQKKPRYMTYPHFAQDDNFKKYLQDIIDEHTKKGAGVLQQFKAIRFLQSLTHQIDNELAQVEKDLIVLVAYLKKIHPDFKALDINALESIINTTIQSDASKEIILDMLYTGIIQDNLSTMDHDDFLNHMKICHSDKASYTLFGGYVLLLQSKNIDEHLMYCFKKVLGNDDISNMISTRDMYIGIKFLMEYLRGHVENKLDYEFFGGKSKMETLLINCEEQLDIKVKTSKDKEQSILYSAMM